MAESIDQGSLEEYFRRRLGGGCRLLGLRHLGSGVHGRGYLVQLDTEGGSVSYVLKTVRMQDFGHDYPSDVAQMFLLALETYGGAPGHVRALDVLSVAPKGEVRPIGGGMKYFLLMEQARGISYFSDLEEMADNKTLGALDRRRILALTKYLKRLHSKRKRSQSLYLRKLRDNIGHGECLMGVFDTYPEGALSTRRMAGIEKKCIDRRARLKSKHHRLCRVHGDFHPGNIWFNKPGGVSFTMLDRSRGPWGEPADDVAALTINYVFFSIKRHGSVTGAYLEALRLFMDEYLSITGDDELLKIIAPFYAFRGAVVGNPLFYPDISARRRALIYRFVDNVLDARSFNYKKPNRYLNP